MKKFSDYLLRMFLAVFAVCAVVSCTKTEIEDEPEPEPIPAAPAITSIEAGSEAITQTTASVKVNFEEATEIYTTYYSDSAVPADEDKVWECKSVAEDDSSFELSISDLKVGKSYTFEAYAVNGEIKSAAKSYAFTTLPLDPASISLVAVASSEVSNQIDVVATVSGAISFKYTYYAENERPEDADISWTTIMTETDGDYDFSIDNLPVSAESDLTYVVEAIAYNSDDLASAPVTASAVVAQSEPALSYSVTASTFALQVDINVNEEVCDGYVYLSGTVAEVEQMVPYIADYISYGMFSVSTSDTTIMCLPTYGGLLTPNTEYGIAVAQVQAGEVDATTGLPSYTVVGEPACEAYSTNPIDYSASSVVCDVEISNISAGTANVLISRDDAEKAQLVYYGYILKSELTGSVEEWIEDSGWLASYYATYVQFVSDNWGEIIVNNEISVDITGLSPQTEYVFFSFSVDDSYNAGAIYEEEFTTTDVVTNTEIQHSITNVQTSMGDSYATISFDVNFLDDCDKVYYLLQYGKEISDEEAQETIIATSLGAYPVAWSASNGVNNVYSYLNQWCKSGTTYTLYTIGGNSVGEYSEMQKTIIETPSMSFDSDATLDVSYVSSTPGDYGLISTFSVALTSSSVSYKCGGVKSEEISDPTDPCQCGAALLGTSGIAPSPKTDEEISITLYSTQDIYVFIPIDENGGYGIPVIFNAADL